MSNEFLITMQTRELQASANKPGEPSGDCLGEESSGGVTTVSLQVVVNRFETQYVTNSV